MNKTIYSIGLGPGDPELITIKAKKILEGSDIVVVPQSDVKGRSIAREIVLHYIEPSKVYMYYFPMNNDKEILGKRYKSLAKKIKSFIEEDKCVSYVTLGDPTIYSTSNYLTREITSIGLEIHHIPGISSMNAASSMIGVPLCIKGENFGVYEAPKTVEKTVVLINQHRTTVFMKIKSQLPVLLDAVKIAKPEVAYLARRIGLDEEAIYDLLNGSPPPESAYLSVAVIRNKV